MDLFAFSQNESPQGQPLAEQLRPRKLEDMLGQTKILGSNAPWRRLVDSGQIPSLILWGPPGSGKTTFALLLAQKVDAEFITVNAVETGAKALRELGEAGRRRRLERRRKTLLFLDEIHRLNKGQQDVLLPFVEKGDLILVGATTENPSYEINSALLSRCRIVVFERLDQKALAEMATRACATRNTSLPQLLEPEAQSLLFEYADGDGRRLLNVMEILFSLLSPESEGDEPTRRAEHPSEKDFLEIFGAAPFAVGVTTAPIETKLGDPVDFDVDLNATDAAANRQGDTDRAADGVSANLREVPTAETDTTNIEPVPEAESQTPPRWPLSADALAKIIDTPVLRYDKTADEHYDTISAFIKSVRGSDPDAAMYYLARMIKGGEDPVFLARRLVILASEDIGNADPRAITLAVSGLQAVELVGWPEAAISLAQVTTYLASAPKSNRAYMALQKAQALVDSTGTVPIPLALRSAKTSSMKAMGYGKGYKYSHEGEKGYVRQRFLPEQLGDVTLYEPTDHGFEKNIQQYLNWLKS